MEDNSILENSRIFLKKPDIHSLNRMPISNSSKPNMRSIAKPMVPLSPKIILPLMTLTLDVTGCQSMKNQVPMNIH